MMRTDVASTGREGVLGIGGRRLAILFFAWLMLFAGFNSIPVETHEAFVLQTAREMDRTGDWVLPYYNQKPRLNKPPLNYWLTLGVAKLSGSGFEPWTGRTASMLAGLAALVLTACICAKSHGAMTGFLAALLLLATRGFCSFSHHARPDFLYAVLCVIQLYAWIDSMLSVDGSSRQRLMAALGWALAGLATLAKGPQVPALFLLGFLLFLFCGHERRRTLKILRPFSGVLLFAAITLPWWLLLQQRVRLKGIDLNQTQLSGSLLKQLSSWREILSCYYVIELFRLMLPASLLVPLLAIRNARTLTLSTGTSPAFVCVIMTSLVAFTVAGHYRAHYMLPLLPPVALLVAGWISRTRGASLNRWLWHSLLGIGALGLVGCFGLLLWQKQYVTLVWLTATGAVLVHLVRVEFRLSAWKIQPFSKQLITATLLSVPLFAGFNALPLRNKVRALDRDFGLSINRTLQTGDQLFAWKGFPEVLPYYADNRVKSVKDLRDLTTCFENKGEGNHVFLVTQRVLLPVVTGLFHVTTLATHEKLENRGHELVFLRIDGLSS